MRQALLVPFVCVLVTACTSPSDQRSRAYARDFVQWDAQSDAANTADALCGGMAFPIDGRKGYSPDDYRCAVTPEVEQWLSSYKEVIIMTLKTRNVRKAGDATCGEASFELHGSETGYRPFVYVPNGDSIFATGGPIALPDAAQCPVTDEILSICAPTAPEREAAELRLARCQLSTPL